MSNQRSRDEYGAVALLTALLVVILLVLSAFVVDFGMAYNSKRKLQTAADAAALAAAATYSDHAGSCSVLAANAAYRATAESTADAIAAENRPEFDDGSIVDVACNDDGELEVTYEISGSTDLVFGSLAIAGDEITTDREAAATLDAPGTVTGLRPYALCGAALPSGPLPSAVIKVDQPGAGHMPTSLCPDSRRGGNWWTIDCPEAANNGMPGLIAATYNGCEEEVGIVPNQGSLTGAALSGHLVGYCNTRKPECLSANPGNLRNNDIEAAWQSLTDRNAEIVLPVFCAPANCTPAAITKPGGNNTIYPVWRMVGVTVCGFHWGNRTGHNFSGACANNPQGYSSSQGNNQDNYMLLVFSHVQTSGTTKGSSCALGSACDRGIRRVLLTR